MHCRVACAKEQLVASKWVKRSTRCLNEMARQNKGVRVNPNAAIAAFESVSAPEISLQDYMDTILLKCLMYGCPDSLICWQAALTLIDRFCQYLQLPLTDLTVHRISFTAFVIAHKVISDCFVTNRFFARVGGVELENLNAMENAFLTTVNFDVHVSAMDIQETRDRFDTKHSRVIQPEAGSPLSSASSASPRVSKDAIRIRASKRMEQARQYAAARASLDSESSEEALYFAANMY
eukprot:Sspe_Gene.40099::Locus_19337_Transcript_1_1_Confidence_1.000_Length_1163::g.40099::m.40099